MSWSSTAPKKLLRIDKNPRNLHTGSLRIHNWQGRGGSHRKKSVATLWRKRLPIPRGKVPLDVLVVDNAGKTPIDN
jgi:hypothetical protein